MKNHKIFAFLAFCKDRMQVFEPACQTDASTPNFEFENDIKNLGPSGALVVKVAAETAVSLNSFQMWQ